MILDKLNEFADATALSTTGTATLNIGNQIDLSVASMDLGAINDIYCVVEVDTAITSTGSATVDFRLVSGDAAAISTTGGATVHITTGAIAKATLAAKYKVFAISLPRGTYKRYLGIQTVIGTSKLSAGKINAYLTNNPTLVKAYARGD